MFSRWSAFVCISFTFLPLTGVFAQVQGQPLANTDFVNWHGALDQIALPDNSTLSEYVAQTSSQNIPDASLQVSFTPRFSCSPMISMTLSARTAASINDDFALQLTIDGEDMTFPVLLDELTATRQYSYNGNRDEQQALLQRLDDASQLSVHWVPATHSQGSDRVNTAIFSLLGSRMSARAVAERCEQHEPVPY